MRCDKELFIAINKYIKISNISRFHMNILMSNRRKKINFWGHIKNFCFVEIRVRICKRLLLSFVDYFVLLYLLLKVMFLFHCSSNFISTFFALQNSECTKEWFSAKICGSHKTVRTFSFFSTSHNIYENEILSFHLMSLASCIFGANT